VVAISKVRPINNQRPNRRRCDRQQQSAVRNVVSRNTERQKFLYAAIGSAMSPAEKYDSEIEINRAWK
jgi:hypothetical protein